VAPGAAIVVFGLAVFVAVAVLAALAGRWRRTRVAA
jgi:hypothetical protein